MLPNSITRHPYFHQGINEKKAYDILAATPDENGNCLFCEVEDNTKNHYLFVYKLPNSQEIKTLTLGYDEQHQASQCTSKGQLSGDFVTYGIWSISNAYIRYASLYDFIESIPSQG